MKKLLALGTVLGAAAYLQKKERRDRLMSQGRDLLDSVKQKARNLKSQASETGQGERLFSDAEVRTTTPTGSGMY